MDPTGIGIDGYNLALPNGTGVATYGHALATVLGGRGHRMTGVFGIDAGRDPTARDVAFFETYGRPPAEPTLEQRRRAKKWLRRRALWPLLERRAVEVPLTGQIETRPLAERLPAFDRIVTSPRLFDLAHRHFAAFGRLLPVRMINPPPIMHWTYPVPLRMVGSRNVYTLHDLVPLRLPYTTLENKRGYRRLIARLAATADHLCTVSEASRQDILAGFDIDPARVTNTWQAAPMPPDILARSPEEDAASVRAMFGLEPRGYFLFFGAIEPKKNVGRLLEAFLGADLTTPLVIVGGRGWQNEGELHLLAHAAGANGAGDPGGPRRVIRLDHLSRGLLLRLLRSARAALFPSISEGFGLPILEAMQLGTPVLTANVSAMPEVAGGAALLVDPYDPLDIARALARLDAEPGLRERLGAAGLRRARFFSTETYADRLEAMYGAAMAAR